MLPVRTSSQLPSKFTSYSHCLSPLRVWHIPSRTCGMLASEKKQHDIHTLDQITSATVHISNPSASCTLTFPGCLCGAGQSVGLGTLLLGEHVFFLSAPTSTYTFSGASEERKSSMRTHTREKIERTTASRLLTTTHQNSAPWLSVQISHGLLKSFITFSCPSPCTVRDALFFLSSCLPFTLIPGSWVISAPMFPVFARYISFWSV